MVQGKRDGSACNFSFSGSLARGAAGVEEDEVAFNPSTCEAIYATGPIQHPDPGARAGGSSTAGGPASSAARARAASTTAAFHLRTFYEDPIGIDVTSLRNDLEWNYTYGVCNNWYKWKRNATWYTPTGWGLDSVGDRPSFSCGKAQRNSHADMKNYAFCVAFLATWNHYYYDHYVWGGYHGVAHYGWNDSKSGDCSELLSHHYSVGWESPW